MYGIQKQGIQKTETDIDNDWKSDEPQSWPVVIPWQARPTSILYGKVGMLNKFPTNGSNSSFCRALTAGEARKVTELSIMAWLH